MVRNGTKSYVTACTIVWENVVCQLLVYSMVLLLHNMQHKHKHKQLVGHLIHKTTFKSTPTKYTVNTVTISYY